MKTDAKLALGGAQLGMAYGATNHAGAPSASDLEAIFLAAAEGGLDLVDTAPAYGNSETAIGDAAHGAGFDIITKTPPAAQLVEESGALRRSLKASLQKLKRPKVAGLLFHEADVLLGPEGPRLFDEAQALKSEGLVERVGVSVYTHAQIEAVLTMASPEIIQLPMNVFDQRMLGSGILDVLQARDIEVHVRSAFLQGVLLSSPEALPERLEALRPALREWHGALLQAGVSPAAAALAFLRAIPAVDRIIIGVTSRAQLEDILEAYRQQPKALPYERFAQSDPALVDPREW